MCGIAGFSRNTAITRGMAPILVYEIEKRGRDSWGMTCGTDTIKHLGNIFDSWEPIPEGWDSAIIHTRAGSVGETSIPNQHPFVFEADGTKIVGVHNGCLYNHTEIQKKHNREFEVDSMHIFAHIAEGKDTEELRGWGALAWYQITAEQKRIFLARFNMTDFHVFRLKTGEMVFCSYAEPVRVAARMMGTSVEALYTLEKDKCYYIAPNPNNPEQDILWTSERELKFGDRAQTATTHYVSEFSASDEMDFREYWRSREASPTGHRYQYGGMNSRPGDVIKPIPKRKYEPSLIGAKSRVGNLCVQCKEFADRKVTPLCDECMTRFLGVWERKEAKRKSDNAKRKESRAGIVTTKQ